LKSCCVLQDHFDDERDTTVFLNTTPDLQDQDQDQYRFFWPQTGLVLRPTVSDHITGFLTFTFYKVVQGLKWGQVARVGDPAPFDLPGLYRVSCLLSCSSESHKIPLRMYQNSPFSDKNKFCGGGTRPRIAGETRLLFWTTLSTEVVY